MKKFIKSNKIFFEIFISFTSLSIAATAAAISFQSYKIIESQTAIMESQIKPNFWIENEFIENLHNNLIIYNEKNPVKNLKIEPFSFLSIDIIDKLKFYNKTFPVYSYYFGGKHISNTTGKVKKIYGVENYKKFLELQEQVNKYYKEKDKTISIEINNYIKISYEDINKKKHTEYYDASSNFIDEQEGEKKFLQYNKSFLDFNSLQLEKIIEIIESNNETD